MTTIITKNGSGAPTAGQLSQGELAVDLTNKELYTKDSGGNVIKVGAQGGSTGTFTDLTATSSFTSPGIDDNANATAITIDVNENVGIGTLNPASRLHVVDVNPVFRMQSNGASTVNAFSLIGRALDSSAQYNTIKQVSTSGGQFGTLAFCNGPSETERMRIDTAGNVGIGQSSPSSFSAQARDLVIGNTATAAGGLSIITTSAGNGNICFGDATSTSDSSRRGKITYDHADNSMSFDTLSAERMRIDSTGNVGIGNTDPQDLLTVSGARNAINLSVKSAGRGLEISNLDGIAGTANGLVDFNSTGADDFAGELSLSTNSTERMRIDSAGNVGIGETNPSSQLHVSGTSSTKALFEKTGATGAYIGLNDSSGNFVYLGDNNGTFQVQTSGSSYSTKMAITPDGNVGIGETNPSEFLHISGASPAMRLDNSSGTTDWLMQNTDNSMRWVSTPAAGGSSAERMRLDGSGNLLVGRTAVGAGVDNGVQISPDGSSYWDGGTAGRNIGFTPASIDLQFKINSNYSGSTTTRYFAEFTHNSVNQFRVNHAGTIYATATSITSISDESLKENIRDLDKGLEAIMALKPRRFDWKSGDGDDIMGFIAQEVDAVLPELVHDYEYRKDEIKLGIKMGDMIPSMVKAIQELSAQVNELKAEVAALKGA